MQTLLDHLTSIIVAGVLLLGLQVNQVRTQHANVEQVASHAVKAKTLVFGRWVEDDILNIGANFGTNLYRFERPEVDAETGNTTRWVFFSDSTRVDGSSFRIFKRYRLAETGTAAYRDTTYQLYEVLRDSALVDYDRDNRPPTIADVPTSAWVYNTRSIGTLSFFQVDLLDRLGETPLFETGIDAGQIDVTKVDFIRVRFGVVPEYTLKPDNYIRELYWVRTLKIRPYWVPPPSLEG